MWLTKPDKIFINKLETRKKKFLSSLKTNIWEARKKKKSLEAKYGSHIFIRCC